MQKLMVAIFSAAVLGLTAILTACSTTTTEGYMRSSPEGQLLLAAFDDLRFGRMDELRKRFDASVSGEANFETTMQTMAAAVPKDEPKYNEFLGWHVFTNTKSGRTSDTTAQFQFDSTWILAQMNFSGEPGQMTITGFHIQKMPHSFQEMTAFSLSGKSAGQYAFLLLAVTAFLASIAAFITCLMTPRFHRKWLWAIFTLISVVGFSMNWTTGDVSILPLYFNIPAAGYTQDGSGVWHLIFAIPVGAIAFFFKWRSLRRSTQDTPANL